MLLHHYTDTAGLIGILSSKTLWATDAEYLNDAQELRHGRTEMINALRAEAARLIAAGGSTFGSPLADRATTISAAADSLERETPDRAYPGPYVVCFCAEGDLLSQWRGYAGGHGWALGFDPDQLKACATSWDPSESALQQITYGSAGITNAATRAVQLTAPQPENHPAVKGEYKSLVVCRRELARIKHQAFAEEKEWRLIILQESSINSPGPPHPITLGFRDGAIGLTPYVPVPWPADALQQLTIGPTPYPAQQRSALERLLRTTGLNPNELRIEFSDAPYR